MLLQSGPTTVCSAGTGNGLSDALTTLATVWRYQLFRRSPDSSGTPEEWVDALLSEGWETWCGRGAWCRMQGVDVFGVWLRRFEAKLGGPTREATLVRPVD